MDRWNKPCNEKADKMVPGFLVNLGPTGARAILKKKSFVVKYIFKNSPVARELKINDEIIGVNGKKFTKEHVYGTFYGIKSKPGLEGPFMDFGNAIKESEGKDGLLKLRVKRGGKEIEVRVRLKAIGRFSPTFPFKCRKSARLVSDALRYLTRAGDKGAIRKVLDYNKAFINMMRTHDGSFVAQPGRNHGDKGYYMSSRLHPTAAMILILSMDRPKLRIQGAK